MNRFKNHSIFPHPGQGKQMEVNLSFCQGRVATFTWLTSELVSIGPLSVNFKTVYWENVPFWEVGQLLGGN